MADLPQTIRMKIEKRIIELQDEIARLEQFKIDNAAIIDMVIADIKEMLKAL